VFAIFAATAMAVRLLQSAAVRGLALTGAIRGVTPLASTCAVQPSSQISAIHCSAAGEAAQVEVAHADDEPFPKITALCRDVAGSKQSRDLRRNGLLPGALQGLPGNTTKNLILNGTLVSSKIKKLGPITFQSRAWTLEVFADENDEEPEYFHVVPRLVHIGAVSRKVENVTFLAVEKGAPVKVNVVVELLGDDVSPGVKLGGFPFILMRTIPLICPSDKIPEIIQVDVSRLGTEERVLLDELPLPPGCSVDAKNQHVPVVKVKGKARQPQPGVP